MDTDYYTRLSLDLSSPFFNKATQQTTAPGSTLKLLSAVTGMMENLVDDSTYIECTGKFDLVNPPINCWNKSGHGSLEIRGAIEQSCNMQRSLVWMKTQELKFQRRLLTFRTVRRFRPISDRVTIFIQPVSLRAMQQLWQPPEPCTTCLFWIR